MLLSIDELVKIVRESLNIKLPTDENEDCCIIDPAYAQMTDDDIKLFIKLGITRVYPEVEDLSELPDDCSEYAFVLLAQIEIYMKLAVMRADFIDLGADGAYLKKSQRFDHYMQLAKQAQALYDKWLDSESASGHTVTSFDVLLADRHFTKRNYEKQKSPKVRLVIDSITAEDIMIHWSITNSSKFGRYVVYISEEPIVDMYRDGAYYTNKVNDTATLVKKTGDIRDCYCEINGLKPQTIYYIAVVSVERNQVFGFSEKTFTTLEALSDDDLTI